MYEANMEFIQNNQVMMTILCMGGLATWWGIFKGTVKPWLIASLVITVLVFTSSAFLYIYCKWSGVDADTIKSQNVPLLAAAVFWVLIGVCVVEYSGKKIDNRR